MEPAHGHASQETADIGKGVMQNLAGSWIDGDPLLEVLAEGTEVGNLVVHRRADLKRLVPVHLAARWEGAHAIGSPDSIIHILPQLLQRGLKQVPASLQCSLLIS